MNTENNLQRFISAQESIYRQVVQELRDGKKTSHWMWFIFPQMEGLGQSSTAKYYSIKNIDEAKNYLAHPVLGARLLECTNILLQINSKTADEIFGYPDNMKLRSSMTLFNYIDPAQNVFADVLEKYFTGEPDQRTLAILNS